MVAVLTREWSFAAKLPFCFCEKRIPEPWSRGWNSHTWKSKTKAVSRKLPAAKRAGYFETIPEVVVVGVIPKLMGLCDTVPKTLTLFWTNSAIFFQIIWGDASAFVHSIPLFAVVRFILGFSLTGVLLSQYIYVMEWKHEPVCFFFDLILVCFIHNLVPRGKSPGSEVVLYNYRMIRCPLQYIVIYQ